MYNFIGKAFKFFFFVHHEPVKICYYLKIIDVSTVMDWKKITENRTSV